MLILINKRHIIFPIFALWFVASPVLSTQETADPSAAYVLAIVIPTFLCGITCLKLQIKPYHVTAFLMWFFCSVITLLSPFAEKINLMQVVKYLAFILFFVIISLYHYTDKDLKLIAKGYIVVAITIAFAIFLSYLRGYQHVSEDGDGETLYYLGRYSIGITGLYKNPNYLASFILVAVLILLNRIKVAKISFKEKIFIISLVVLCLVACFLTGTRAALVVFFMIVVGVYASSFTKLASLRNLLPLLILIVVIITVYGNSISELMDLYLAGRELMADEGREEAWPMALRLVSENFLLGRGIDSWHMLSKGSGALNNLHNVFLEFFLNQGIVGMFLLLHIVMYGWKKSKKADHFFLIMLLLVTALPLSFQNGVIAVNFWRFIIINRLALNYSIYSEKGLVELFKSNN